MFPSRKSLQVLQKSAHNQRLLVGGSGVVRLEKQKSAITELTGAIKKLNENEEDMTCEKTDVKMSKKSKENKESEVVNRPKSKSTPVERNPTGKTQHDNKETDTQDLGDNHPFDGLSPQEILQWMTKKELPENNWRILAEQRRVALEETLKENEELHTRIDALMKEIELLKETNATLQEMAEHGEHLANILQELSDDSEETETNTTN